MLSKLARLHLLPANVASDHFEHVGVVLVRSEVGLGGEALRTPLEWTLDSAAGALVQLRVLLEALQTLQHLAAHIAQVRNSFFPRPFFTFSRGPGYSLCGERQLCSVSWLSGNFLV